MMLKTPAGMTEIPARIAEPLQRQTGKTAGVRMLFARKAG